MARRQAGAAAGGGGRGGVVGGQQAERLRRLILALRDLHPPRLSALPAEGCLPHLLQQPRPGV